LSFINKDNEFLDSMRGQLIIAKALHIAVETLEAKPEIEREDSDIADMRYLQKEVFTFPFPTLVKLSDEAIADYRKQLLENIEQIASEHDDDRYNKGLGDAIAIAEEIIEDAKKKD
jgi:hypothetical protein